MSLIDLSNLITCIIIGNVTSAGIIFLLYKSLERWDSSRSKKNPTSDFLEDENKDPDPFADVDFSKLMDDPKVE